MNEEMNFGFGDGFDDYEDDDSGMEDEYFETEPDFVEDDYDDDVINESEITFTGGQGMDCITEHELFLLRQQETLQKSTFDEVFNASQGNENIISPNETTFETEIPAEKQAENREKEENFRKMFIGNFEWTVQQIKEGTEILEKTSADNQKVRTYNKEAKMPEIKYDAPAEESSFGKKLFLAVAACLGTGGLFGVYANSYMAFHQKDEPTPMGCAIGWIAEFDSLPVTMSPFFTNVFASGFGMGAGILAIIILFIWLDSDQKKQSRVGHEHGKARLGSSRDFKIYKNKFMEK